MVVKHLFIFFIIYCIWTPDLNSQEAITELLKVQGKKVSVDVDWNNILVKTDRSYHLIDSLGNVYFELDRAEGDRLQKAGYNNNLLKLRSNGLEGLLDSLGQEVVPPLYNSCLLYTSPNPRDATLSRMPSSA